VQPPADRLARSENVVEARPGVRHRQYAVGLDGIMRFDEIVAGIRHQRRSRTQFEGEPLRSDRALWMHWNRGAPD
jgi:hypothetical protein